MRYVLTWIYLISILMKCKLAKFIYRRNWIEKFLPAWLKLLGTYCSSQAPIHFAAQHLCQSICPLHPYIPVLLLKASASILQIVNCTTPANYFHVLRRQMNMDFRKPVSINFSVCSNSVTSVELQGPISESDRVAKQRKYTQLAVEQTTVSWIYKWLKNL